MLAVLGVAPTTAWAYELDLTGTPGDLGAINDGVFVAGETGDAAGTGTLDSFVRMHRRHTQQGYNTSGRPVWYDEVTDPNYTRDLQLFEVPTVTFDGANYYEFLLDINEPDNSRDRYLSLDELKLYIAPSPLTTPPPVDELASLRYSLDAWDDSRILLDFSLVNTGSGRADMTALIPTDLFAGDSGTDFVTLYSRFGDKGDVGGKNWGSASGFEEWAVRAVAPSHEPTNPVPEPITMILSVSALLGLRHYMKRRNRPAEQHDADG